LLRRAQRWHNANNAHGIGGHGQRGRCPAIGMEGM
jgi:hypothetical protein